MSQIILPITRRIETAEMERYIQRADLGAATEYIGRRILIDETAPFWSLDPLGIACNIHPMRYSEGFDLFVSPQAFFTQTYPTYADFMSELVDFAGHQAIRLAENPENLQFYRIKRPKANFKISDIPRDNLNYLGELIDHQIAQGLSRGISQRFKKHLIFRREYVKHLISK